MINPISYIKESRAELAKVVWLSRNDTLKLTLLVIFVSVLIGAYIAGIDTFFTVLVEKFLVGK